MRHGRRDKSIVEETAFRNWHGSEQANGEEGLRDPSSKGFTDCINREALKTCQREDGVEEGVS
jgi:hypothetical protein